MKCPVCGYEFEYGMKATNYKNVVTKGDEAFVKIMMPQFNDARFETDKEYDVSYGERSYEKGYLYGCPKCNTVQFEIY